MPKADSIEAIEQAFALESNACLNQGGGKLPLTTFQVG